MLIGINWTSPYNFKLISELAATGLVDFCEILIDNFFNYEPEQIKEALPLQFCAFHIMNSHFLERSTNEMEIYAAQIKRMAKVLNPLYVSDHIGKFSLDGRLFPFMNEINYENFFEKFKKDAISWSSMLEVPVYYENFPSLCPQKERQTDFYLNMQNKLSSHANILFDFSNAIIAEKNGCEAAYEWIEIAKKTSHFHVGGYEQGGRTKYYVDSHNKPLSVDTINFIKKFKPYVLNESATIVVERDFNLNFDEWYNDIEAIKALF
jgi:hypothetical protein